MNFRTKASPLPTEELTAGDRALLFALTQSETYRALLDVMHRFVVGEETQLINTSPDDVDAVLGQWHNARACWAMFAHMQYKVAEAARDYALVEEERAATPEHALSVDDVLGYE